MDENKNIKDEKNGDAEKTANSENTVRTESAPSVEESKTDETAPESAKNTENAGKQDEEPKKETAQSLNEELKEFNKEHGVTLDSPLVVHKKGDVSYEESTDAYEMTETHTGEERPTLKRHRFKKEKKKSKAPYIVILIIVIIAAVFAGLFYAGNITIGEKKTTAVLTTESTTENLLEKYKGTIVVKGTYIFVDGQEVNGIEGLQNALKYVDPSPTAYEIIVENENKEFLNYEVLALLENMGFFSDQTTVTHVDTTGLMASEETTAETAAPETAADAQAQTAPSETAAPEAAQPESNAAAQ